MAGALLEKPLQWRDTELVVEHTRQRRWGYAELAGEILYIATREVMLEDLTAEARALAVEASKEFLLDAASVVHAQQEEKLLKLYIKEAQVREGVL